MSWFSVESLEKRKKVEALSRWIRRKRQPQSRQAAEALARIGDGEAVRALVKLAASNDILIWEPAQAALASITNPEAVPSLTDALFEQGHPADKPILAALARIPADAALDALLKALTDARLAPDALTALKGKRNVRIVEALRDVLEREVAAREEEGGSRVLLWRNSICRDVIALLGDTGDIQSVQALHRFLREHEAAPLRLRIQAARALADIDPAGRQAVAGYVGEDLRDVKRVQLLLECMPADGVCNLLLENMPGKAADELVQSLIACLGKCDEGLWKYIVYLLERLDRDSARSGLLLWFVQSKAASKEAGIMLARHGDTRPVLVKRLVDMVRSEEAAIRKQAGEMLVFLTNEKLITEEGAHLVSPEKDGDGAVVDYRYIGP